MCMSSLRSVLMIILSVAPRCKLLNVDELEPPARPPGPRIRSPESGDSTYENCAGDDVSMYNP